MCWIKLHRRLLDWEWSNCPEMVALWVHLLLRANYAERECQGRVIGIGKMSTSVADLSRSTGLSVKQVRTCLERLEKDGAIERASQRANKGARACTIISICNYESYQCLEKGEGKQKGKPMGEQKGNNKRNVLKKETTLSKERLVKKETVEAVLSFAKELEESVCKDSKKAEYNLSGIDEELKPLFLDFIAMRKKIGKPLKTQLGITARYNRLQKLSGGDVSLAKKIIRQSLEYEWQDFYSLKSEEEKLRQKKKSGSEQYSDETYW